MTPSAEDFDDFGENDDLVGAFAALGESVDADPMAHVELTLAQLAWVRMRGPRLLWRGANQIGKSFSLAYKLLCFIRRIGPYADRNPGPVRVLMLSTSKEQMIPLMEKLWSMVSRAEVCRSARKKNGRSVIEPLEFVDGFGFTGKPPRIYFNAGPGLGSLIQFATYKQGSGRIAGGTFDLVILDEPPPEKVWGEVMPRVMTKSGDVWVGFTPTPESPPLDYMRKMVKNGSIAELHTELTVESMTLPATNHRPARYLKTQKAIDDYAETLLPAERDMRLRGGWEIIVTERLLMGYGPHCLMPDREMPPPTSKILVGGDHGSAPGRQYFALVAIDGAETLFPRVWLLNEYRPIGFSDALQDAQGILRMIKSTGERLGVNFTYDHVNEWVCDRASGKHEHGVRKSNDLLARFLARELGREVESLKPIHTPTKFGGSVTNGQALMNLIMNRKDEHGRSNFRVWEGCTAFTTAAQRYQGDPRDKNKDPIDGARYPIEWLCRPPTQPGQIVRYA